MPIERGTSQMQLHEYLEGEMTFENPIKPTKLLSTVYCTYTLLILTSLWYLPVLGVL